MFVEDLYIAFEHNNFVPQKYVLVNFSLLGCNLKERFILGYRFSGGVYGHL